MKEPPAVGARESVPAVARELARGLRQMGDPVRARGAERYFKHAIVALGVTTPQLRQFVRERVKPLRKVWAPGDAVALCDRLLQAPEMEIRGAGILFLGAFEQRLGPDLLDRAERWLHRRLDNWALVDGFCSAVLSPLLKRHPAIESRLAAWSRAECLWVRRAALVTLVPSARRGGHLDLAYRLAAQHWGDPEDLMHKATGWLLREAGKTDPARLRRFLLQHGPAVPRTAVRYAIERFPAKERAELLRLTRPRRG